MPTKVKSGGGGKKKNPVNLFAVATTDFALGKRGNFISD